MYSILSRNQDINNPEYFKCCCCVHVKQGALVIAIISIVLAGFFQLIFFRDNITLSVSTLIAIMVIVAGSWVIYADREEKAWAYIPYLVVQTLAIICYLVPIFTLLVFGINPQKLTYKKEEFFDVRIACFATMGIFIIVEAVAIWCWSIVFRAYRYTREVLSRPSLGENCQ